MVIKTKTKEMGKTTTLISLNPVQPKPTTSYPIFSCSTFCRHCTPLTLPLQAVNNFSRTSLVIAFYGTVFSTVLTIMWSNCLILLLNVISVFEISLNTFFVSIKIRLMRQIIINFVAIIGNLLTICLDFMSRKL